MEEARGSAGDGRPGGPLACITWLKVVKGGLGAVCLLGSREDRNGKTRTGKILPGDGKWGSHGVAGTRLYILGLSFPFCKNGCWWGVVIKGPPSQTRPLLEGPRAEHYVRGLPSSPPASVPLPAGRATCLGYSLRSAPPAPRRPGGALGWESVL